MSGRLGTPAVSWPLWRSRDDWQVLCQQGAWAPASGRGADSRVHRALREDRCRLVRLV